jgi:hypothetical protein
MKTQLNWWLMGLFFVIVPLVGLTLDGKGPAQGEEAMITVLNPRGKPSSITLVPMAPRFDTLDGKTVYFVDVRFPGTETFIREMMVWFNKNMPEVKTEFRSKAGSMFDDDPKLWAEIKEKGNAVVMGLGH